MMSCECGRRAGPAGKCDRCSDRLGVCRDCGCGLEQPDPEQIDWESVALDLGYQPSADMIAAVTSCCRNYRVTVCEGCKAKRLGADAEAGGYAKSEPPSPEQRLTDAGVPRSMWGASSDRCNLPSGEHGEVLSGMLRSVRERRQLYCSMVTITGGIGVGKSTYCAIIATEMLSHGRAAHWVEFGQWIKEASEAEDRETRVGNLARFPGLLVLDDFISKPSDWKRDAVFTIINTRTNHLLDTLINTSASMAEISACWGRAVASRLQRGLVVSWGGRDRRGTP